MPVISIQRDTNNNVSLVRMISTDGLAAIDGTDYIAQQQETINALNGGVWQWFITDMILVAADDGNAFFEFIDDTFTSLVIFGSIGSGIINPGMTNQLPYYSSNGRVLSPLPNMANAILATNGSQVPGLTQTLPTAVQGNITTVGTIASGVWNGTPVTVPFGGSALSSLTAYAVLCGGTTSTSAMQQVSGVGTSGQLLTSNGPGLLPTWQASPGSGTVSPGLQNQIAYYATNGSTVSGLTSIASGVLITSGLGVPSISQTLPSAVQGNITALGTIATGIWQGTNIALNHGGTNASLTASNGGIVYSTATALAILAGTATANQVLLSGSSTTPAWSTATYPATTTINQLLYSSVNNVIGGVTAGNFGVLISSSSGVPSWLANGTTGQVLTATTSGTPSWAPPAASSVTFTGDSGTPFSGAAVTVSAGTTGLNFAAASPALTLTGIVNLTHGGTNNSLTASNGGIVWSDASKLNIIGGTATANQVLLSGSSATPTWSTATYPSVATSTGTILRANGTNWVASTATFADTYTASNLLYSNGTNTVTGLATGNDGVLVTSAGGVPSISTTLPNNLAMQTPASISLTNASNLKASAFTAGNAAIPAFSAYDNAGTVYAANAATQALFATEEFDIGNYYDTTTSTYTPLVAGLYFFNVAIGISGALATDRYIIQIYKNGAQVKNGIEVSTDTSGFLNISAHALISMNGSTDNIKAYFFNSNGAATRTSVAGSIVTYFQGFWVGPAS